MCHEPDISSLKTGPPHVHGNRAVIFHVRTNDAFDRFAGNRRFVGQPKFSHKNSKATRAIAAHFDFTAAAVENAVLEVNFGQSTFFNHQQLITSDAVATIAQRADLFGRQGKRFLRGVQHDKVVARALHFGKSHSYWSD